MVSELSGSPGTTRVELAVEEAAQDDATKLKTQIHLSTLKYTELVALTSQESKNETDRLNAVLAITSADGKSAEWKKKSLITLLEKWAYIHATAVANAQSEGTQEVTLRFCVPPLFYFHSTITGGGQTGRGQQADIANTLTRAAELVPLASAERA